MDNPWSRFEYRRIIQFTGHKVRHVTSRRELERVGLDADDYWNSANAFDDHLQRTLNCSRLMRTTQCFSVTMAHYRALKVAQGMHAKSALMMENDARFMVDANRVRRMVESLPDDYDMAMLGWITKMKDHSRICADLRAINERSTDDWIHDPLPDYRGFECYALSSRGIDWFCRSVEETIRSNVRMVQCDQYVRPTRWDESLRFYRTRVHACVQGVSGTGAGEAGGTSDASEWERYTMLGLRRCDYALYEGD